MSNINDKSNEVKYYSSPHTKSGFVQSLTLQKSKRGNDYYSMKFSAQIGSSKENEFAFHSLNMVGKQAREFIDQHGQEIQDVLQANKVAKKQDKNAKSTGVYLVLNISDDQARTFESNGKTIAYIYGRCTSVKYLSIGGEVVFKRLDSTSTEVATDDSQESAQEAKVDATETTQPVNTSFHINPETGEMLEEVSLTKDDANFNVKKNALKQAGCYHWNNDKKVWRLKS